MPFFRYECRNCGYEFRHLHVEGADDPVTCPKCAGTDLERQPPRVAIQFKGSGFYKTDRADKKSKVGTKGPSDKDSSTESGSAASNGSGESGNSAPDKSSDKS
jgi:putative FmdB family regulatory protein